MPTLQIFLFGTFCVRRDNELLSGLDGGKVQELFGYLLLHRGQSHSREVLASLLWGDSPAAQSRKYLRQALWQLQGALNGGSEQGNGQVVLVESDQVDLNGAADLWLDVATFEQAFAQAQEISGHLLEPHQARALREAVGLYRGDLLESWYSNWCLFERERLQNMCLAMLDKLMVYCEAQQQYETGLTYGTRILGYDRARERTHRRLMRLYYLAGDRTAALRQYERCVATLHEELAVEPARATVALYEQVRADRLEAPVSMPPSDDARPPGQAVPGSLPQILSHLKQLHAALASIQRRVQEEIQAVELILHRRR